MGRINSSINAKNYILNGNFDVWQRGSSFNYNTAAFNYGADRWGRTNFQILPSVSIQNFVQSGSHPGNSRYTMRVGGNGVSNSWLVGGQGIESTNTYGLRGKKITVSGYIKFSAASWSVNPSFIRLILGYTNATADATYANSDYTPNNSFVDFTQGSLPTTWTRFVITITVGSSANNIGFNWGAGAAATYAVGDWFELSQVMLNEGSVAAPFQTCGSDYADELALCQRYYEKSYDSSMVPGTSTGNGIIQYRFTAAGSQASWIVTPFKVSKRISLASLTLFDSAGNSQKVTMLDSSMGNMPNITPQSFVAYENNLMVWLPSNINYYGVNFHFVVNAEL